MIRFACPGCAATFTVDDNRSGKSGKCPKCQSEFVIPDMEPIPQIPTPTPVSVSIPAPAPQNADEPVEIEPCPKCSTKLSVSAGDIGNDVECPYCKTVFQAIKPGSRPPAPPVAPARKSQFESTDDTGRPKSRRNDSDDDGRPRKRRRDVDDDDDEDEDDIPKIKSKSESRRRDEDDEPPKIKSKVTSRRRNEDDEDDSPKRKSRRRDEEDEEDDDRPNKKRYRRGGGGDSRKTTITRIGVLACGKVVAMMIAVTTFIFMLFVVLIGLIFGSAVPRAGGGPDFVSSIFSGGILALFLAPICSGIGGFIYGMIIALIYNVASGIAGGFEMEIEDD